MNGKQEHPVTATNFSPKMTATIYLVRLGMATMVDRFGLSFNEVSLVGDEL